MKDILIGGILGTTIVLVALLVLSPQSLSTFIEVLINDLNK